MSRDPPPDRTPPLAAPPGLCATCAHREVLRAQRSAFVRCRLSDSDPRFPRYPVLPVVTCEGYRRS